MLKEGQSCRGRGGAMLGGAPYKQGPWKMATMALDISRNTLKYASGPVLVDTSARTSLTTLYHCCILAQ